MNPISPWLLTAQTKLYPDNLPALYEQEHEGYRYKVLHITDALWLVVYWPSGCRVAFRLAFAPGEGILVEKMTTKDHLLVFELKTVPGVQCVTLQLPGPKQPVLHWTTTLKPVAPLYLPFWPRDILPLAGTGINRLVKGEVKALQTGGRSGQLYFHLTEPAAGAVFYWQNLTSLAQYNSDTETSAGDTVGGEWPDVGFALPPNNQQKPLKTGKTYTISDAYVALSAELPSNEAAMARQYLDLFATVYLALPKPATTYKDWPTILQNGLRDLLDSPGCWSQVDGNHYFNPYMSDHDTPPEIMVQLAVLLPLIDYMEWKGEQLAVTEKVRAGLPAFYSDRLNTILRWHPKAAHRLDGDEEHKKPLVMDAWYLHHPLLNLSRLALKGDKMARELFIGSLGYVIKVAHHFNYTWPVFYHMETLAVIKEETQPGKGGEKDVPGLYAHVMLQAWELTGERRYLDEAEKAARHLKDTGFGLFYQANNTAFSAGAMLRLFKITGKKNYLDLSHLCLANIFNNVHGWECNYGYTAAIPRFFALYPLSDAPYTAAYEEQEVFCAFHDYLRHAEDVDIAPSARLLIAEYIRYLVHRAPFYYPPMLPADMLSEQAKTGELEAGLWVAVEDLYDGWEKSGQVGQEVYGAGNAFGILPRHYMQVPEAGLMIFTEYPTIGFAATKKLPVKFRLAGDGRLSCRIMVVKTGRQKLPALTVVIGNGELVNGTKAPGGDYEFIVPGDSDVTINLQ